MIEYTTIMALTDIGEIMGLDERTYTLMRENVCSIPAGNADVLIEQGMARAVPEPRNGYEVILPEMTTNGDEDPGRIERDRLRWETLSELVRIAIPKKVDRATGAVTEWDFKIDRQKMVLYLTDKFDVISTGGDLWLYKEGAYFKENGEVHAIITNVARTLGLQKQANDDAEISNMLLGTNHYPEPPFNYQLGIIPFKKGYVRINFDQKTTTGPFSHSPNNRFTYILPVEYDPKAPTEPVIEVLKQWVDPADVDLLIQIPAQGFIQAMIDSTFKKSYLIQGERDSGKSSYLELLYRTFGKTSGALSLVSLHNIVMNRFSLASLENRILNVYDELESEELVQWGQFKKLTGATLHEVEEKHKKARNARIFCTHVFACNTPPSVPERARFDPAFWSRWEFIRFPYSHTIDPQWCNRTFTPEFISGFMNLVINHMIKIYTENQLVINHDETEVMERWFQNSDPLYQFIEDNTTDRDTNGRMYNKEFKYGKRRLHTLYLEFCKDGGVDERKICHSIEKFTRDIQKYGFLPRKVRISSKDGSRKSTVVPAYTSTRCWVSGMAQVEPTLDDTIDEKL